MNIRTVPFSDHAIKRYIERFGVAPPEDIEAHLREMLMRAKRIASPTDAQRWLVDDLVFVISARLNKVVTIMIAKDYSHTDPFIEELRQESLELRKELQARLALEAAMPELPVEEEMKLANEREENARRTFDDFRRGKTVTPKALRRAASVLGVAVPGDAALSPGEMSVVERDRKAAAQRVIDDYKRGRHFTLKALRRAAHTLGIPMPFREPKARAVR